MNVVDSASISQCAAIQMRLGSIHCDIRGLAAESLRETHKHHCEPDTSHFEFAFHWVAARLIS
jgi:hypothetical protein